MIVIPAIDLKEGKCVRLEQGLMEKDTVFNDDPAAQGAEWQRQGGEILHIVDLDGAFAGEPKNRAAIEAIVKAVTIAAFTGLFGVALFPELVHSSLNPSWSLDIYNAASSPKTLRIMAAIAGAGMPLVLLYTVVIYRVFRGKVRLDTTSY